MKLIKIKIAQAQALIILMLSWDFIIFFKSFFLIKKPTTRTQMPQIK
jgi:hypothetical protein